MKKFTLLLALFTVLYLLPGCAQRANLGGSRRPVFAYHPFIYDSYVRIIGELGYRSNYGLYYYNPYNDLYFPYPYYYNSHYYHPYFPYTYYYNHRYYYSYSSGRYLRPQSSNYTTPPPKNKPSSPPSYKPPKPSTPRPKPSPPQPKSSPSPSTAGKKSKKIKDNRKLP